MTQTVGSEIDLSQFVFLPRRSTNVVESHSIPSGVFGRYLYESLRTKINASIEQGGFGGNDSFGLYEIDGSPAGSTPFLQILADQTLEPHGARTGLLAELNDAKVFDATRGKHYVDTRALILRGTKKGNRINLPIFEELAQRVDSLEVPAMVYGLKVEAWSQDKNGYGLRLVPTGEFTVIHDDRFDTKWNEYRFNETDERGLPKSLDKENGNRTWYTNDQQLSRLCLYWNLSVYSDDDNLAYSSDSGRVVSVAR